MSECSYTTGFRQFKAWIACNIGLSVLDDHSFLASFERRRKMAPEDEIASSAYEWSQG
jgi:hypothetical protein